MIKNLGGQIASAEVINATTGAGFVGAVLCYITGDGGTQSLGSVGSGVATNEGNGNFSYAPSQAETNYSHVDFVFVGTGAVPGLASYDTITAAQAAALSSSTVTAVGDGPTRTELLAAIAYRMNKTPPPNMDSSTEARLGSFLNQRQRRLLTMPGLKRLRDATITFTSVVGQASYGLGNLAKVNTIYETTNDRVLFEIARQDYRLVEPNPQSGTPEAYVWTGHQAVAVQPALTTLFVHSSSAADTTPVVYLEGVDATGAPLSASVVLTGTTAVSASATLWYRVDKFYLSATAAGTVTLTSTSGGGATLATIAPGQYTTVYAGLLLWPTPSAAITYAVDITRAVTDMVHGTDQTPLPNDFADLLVLGALADEYQHLSDDRWKVAMTEYKERENQLKYWLAETSIGRPFALTRGWQRPSQLGPWFPAGS